MLALLQKGEAYQASLTVLAGEGHSPHWRHEAVPAVVKVMQQLLASPARSHGREESNLAVVAMSSPPRAVVFLLVFSIAVVSASGCRRITKSWLWRATPLEKILLDETCGAQTSC